MRGWYYLELCHYNLWNAGKDILLVNKCTEKERERDKETERESEREIHIAYNSLTDWGKTPRNSKILGRINMM